MFGSRRKTGPLGSCCNDFREALALPKSNFFIQEHNQALYLTVGSIATTEGTGWFDQAVLFCPFCGAVVQTREQVKERAGH